MRNEHICIPFQNGSFIAYRAVHPVLLAKLHLFVAAVEVVAVASLVAQRKYRHARIVPCTHIHVHYPVPVCTVPCRGVPERPVQAVAHAMGFDIRFGVHIESQTVAQFIEETRKRVMAGPDGVDVAPAHEGQVFKQVFPCNEVSGIRVVLMHVHSFEFYRLSVYQKSLPLSALDRIPFCPVFYLELPESDVESGVFAVYAHYKSVEFRVFSRPFPYLRDSVSEFFVF